MEHISVMYSIRLINSDTSTQHLATKCARKTYKSKYISLERFKRNGWKINNNTRIGWVNDLCKWIMK